jgi:hypothetical protein
MTSICKIKTCFTYLILLNVGCYRVVKSPVVSTSGLTAAILDFRVCLASDNVLNGSVEILDPEIWGSRWNFVSIMSTSRVVSTSGLTAAILDFRVCFASDNVLNGSVEILDPKIWG